MFCLNRMLIFIILLVTVFSALAQNVIIHSDFENGMDDYYPWFVDATASWAEPPTADAEFYVYSPGLGGSEKGLYIDVHEPGKYDWYILVSRDVACEQGKKYQISFRATSDEPKTMSIGVHEDLSSGSPFFSEQVEINKNDTVYGPYEFFYESTPKQPGIKMNFGGMPGNVIIDDVVIKEVEIVSDYTPYNSLEDIIGDITLPHEGAPHGVPKNYDWSQGPRKGAQRPPEGWTAAIAWGQLYEWAEGNPAENTRVQIRDMEMLYLSKSDGMWHELQKSLRVEGGAYVEDFVDDISKPADIRNEPDGSISATAGGGYNFHFWPASSRVEIPKDDVDGCFITVQCRLILDDPNDVDDRDDAAYLMSVGGDWWESMTAVWDQWTTNHDMGIGRFRFVTKEWKGYNMISLPEDEVRKNPPPFAGSTLVNESAIPLVNDFILVRNYPNPFNPTTQIQYELPEYGQVKLDIFDISGRLVETLVDGFRPAGRHIVQFNAENLPSGAYLCKLSIADNTAVNKMVLLR